ncbi:hypothetical protein BZA05DRAFT_477191 [Tricharina praecox]|uniref:uncharacterized protein n=1 Tax=Tricharina praecox TaxID=43433 RepID=UPI00221EFF88|nr:uncharacterized protein BZA05DRAFT_477191 [Tricharina praecox]KAI5843614.1 hypothetical protein BZA05DRAFT_477191 [Tricharina praecox]
MNPLSFLLFAVTVTASAVANMGPPKPAKTLSPTVLSDCGCDAVVNIVQKCQTLDPLSFDEATDCICDRSAGWYSGGMGCRDCLTLASDGDTTSDEQLFYEAFGSAITSIFVACTNAGASVKVVDEDSGKGVCGWHSVGGWGCVGFDAEKGTGWASEVTVNTKEVIVGTAEVELDEVEGAKSTKTSSVASPSGVSASGTAAASASASGTGTAAASAAASSAAANATASGAPQETNAPNGAAGLKSSLALVGVVALLIAAF